VLSVTGEIFMAAPLGLSLDVQYMARFVYNLLLLIAFGAFMSRSTLPRRAMLHIFNRAAAFTSWALSLSIILPYILRTGYSTYGDRNGYRGSRGFFYAGNEITAVLMLLLPLTIYIFLSTVPRKKKYFVTKNDTYKYWARRAFYCGAPALAACALAALGTRTAYIAIIGSVAAIGIYVLADGVKGKGKIVFNTVLLPLTLTFISAAALLMCVMNNKPAEANEQTYLLVGSILAAGVFCLIYILREKKPEVNKLWLAVLLAAAVGAAVFVFITILKYHEFTALRLPKNKWPKTLFSNLAAFAVISASVGLSVLYCVLTAVQVKRTVLLKRCLAIIAAITLVFGVIRMFVPFAKDISDSDGHVLVNAQADGWTEAIYRGRQLKLDTAFKDYAGSGPYAWVFGVARGSQQNTIEMDLFEVLFFYGIFGAVIMMYIYITAGIWFVRLLRKRWKSLSVFTLAVALIMCVGYLIIAGHVLFSVTAGFYMIFLILYAKLIAGDTQKAGDAPPELGGEQDETDAELFSHSN